MAVKSQLLLPKQLIYVILMICLLVPFFRPLAFPMVVEQFTDDLFNGVESLQSGDRVLFVTYTMTEWWPEQQHTQFAFMESVLRKPGVKLIIVGTTPYHDSFLDVTFQMIEAHGSFYGKTYGNDYVNLGYLAGQEGAILAMATNFRGQFITDAVLNKPIDELPVMDGVNTLADFAMINHLAEGQIQLSVRHFYSRFPEVPLYGMGGSGFLAGSARAYYPGSGLMGGMAGIPGAAQYEVLMGGPYSPGALTGVDASNLYIFLILALIIIGNIEVRTNLRDKLKGLRGK